MSKSVEVVGRSGGMSRGGDSFIRRKYSVQGYSTELAAREALYNQLVVETGNNPPNLGMDMFDRIVVDETTVGNWEGTVDWKKFELTESQFSFDVGVEQTRVLVPVTPISTYAASGTPSLSLQLIGDRCDGNEPEGADISVPTYRESETHTRTASGITALKAAAKTLVGRTNSAAWKGHAAGEVLLLGVSGTRSGLGDWEITFQWAVRPNQSGFAVSGISVAYKGGWDYLWPVSASRITNGPAQKQITHIAVAQVYYQGNFSALGIGT